MWQSISNQISSSLDRPFVIRHKEPLLQENEQRRMLVQDGEQTFFVKLLPRCDLPQLELELQGLAAIAATKTVRVPLPLCCGTAGDYSFLVMEFLEMRQGTDQDWFTFGACLARMHQASEQAMYGWDEDNYLGKHIQPNQWQRNWARFFAEERIGWQLQLLAEKGVTLVPIDDMVNTVARLLSQHHPKPSLLHGDLWSGNLGFAHGQGVVFDPACYYGDREADVAMTELFGRLPDCFYQGYESIWPLETGYGLRREIYNLYHLLNHFNLFGVSYQNAVETSLHNLLAL